MPTNYHLEYMLIAQVLFSVGGLMFSGAMLIKGKDASVYLPVLTGILGAWMPSPIQQLDNQRRQMQNNPPTLALAPSPAPPILEAPVPTPAPTRAVDNN